MRRVVDGQVAWIDGNATPFGVYCAAFVHQDKPIVLDDVDALYRDTNGIRLLKQLCQSEPSRLLGWHSDPQGLERRRVPAKFTTSSSVAIIANRWSTMNADVAALEDRGHMIMFDPPPIEIHRQAALWFRDQEVFDFVGEYLHRHHEPFLSDLFAGVRVEEGGDGLETNHSESLPLGPGPPARAAQGPTPCSSRRKNERRLSKNEAAAVARPISIMPRSFIHRRRGVRIISQP